jgi:hypothetical protein
MPGTPNIKKFYQNQPTTTAQTIYTAPANTQNQPTPYATAVIKEIMAVNTSGSPATITLGINGTSAANQILPTKTVNPNDSIVITQLNTALSANDTLQALQGTSGAITLIVSGIEVQ